MNTVRTAAAKNYQPSGVPWAVAVTGCAALCACGRGPARRAADEATWARAWRTAPWTARVLTGGRCAAVANDRHEIEQKLLELSRPGKETTNYRWRKVVGALTGASRPKEARD